MLCGRVSLVNVCDQKQKRGGSERRPTDGEKYKHLVSLTRSPKICCTCGRINKRLWEFLFLVLFSVCPAAQERRPHILTRAHLCNQELPSPTQLASACLGRTSAYLLTQIISLPHNKKYDLGGVLKWLEHYYYYTCWLLPLVPHPDSKGDLSCCGSTDIHLQIFPIEWKPEKPLSRHFSWASVIINTDPFSCLSWLKYTRYGEINKYRGCLDISI